MKVIREINDYIYAVDNLFQDNDYKSFFLNKVTLISSLVKNDYDFSQFSLVNKFEKYGFKFQNFNEIIQQISISQINEHQKYLSPNFCTLQRENFLKYISENNLAFLIISKEVVIQFPLVSTFLIISTNNLDFLVPIDDKMKLNWDTILNEINSFTFGNFSDDELNFQPNINEDDDSIEKDEEFKFHQKLKEAEEEIDKQIEFLKTNNLEFIIAKVLLKHYPKEIFEDLIISSDGIINSNLPSPLLITKNNKLWLKEFDMEIKLPPIQKTLYILFLKYPFGIFIKSINSYKKEMYEIYQILHNRSDKEMVDESIERLCNPFDNSLNEKCSKINATLYKLFDKSISQDYCITGKRGEAKYIPIVKKNLVIWDNDKLKPNTHFSNELDWENGFLL